MTKVPTNTCRTACQAQRSHYRCAQAFPVAEQPPPVSRRFKGRGSGPSGRRRRLALPKRPATKSEAVFSLHFTRRGRTAIVARLSFKPLGQASDERAASQEAVTSEGWPTANTRRSFGTIDHSVVAHFARGHPGSHRFQFGIQTASRRGADALVSPVTSRHRAAVVHKAEQALVEQVAAIVVIFAVDHRLVDLIGGRTVVRVSFGLPPRERRPGRRVGGPEA